MNSPFVDQGDSDQTTGQPPQRGEFPPAERSLSAARKLVGPATGAIKVIRRYASVGIALWRVEATLHAKEGPDYELEVEGDSLDEVAFALLDALETCGFSVES